MIGGVIIFILFFILKAFSNAWKKSLKFTIKYGIKKYKYPEEVLKWCIECIDNKIGWYDAKKDLLLKMIDENEVNERMWIYDKVALQLLKNQKGGK